MIDGLKPYPAVKDSGAPWLGAVPRHWAVKRMKSAVTNVIEQVSDRESTDLYIALEHVESWTGRLRPSGPDVAFDSQVKRFRAGDVLFGKLRPYLAKVTRPSADGVCVGEFLVLRPRASETSAPYLEQLLRSKPIVDAVDSSTFGAKMPRADWSFVGSMALPIPTPSEQAAIVCFLDHVDRRIRRYVLAKQKLINLLEEQRQAIIHRAVTRGLDPSVRLKPSGAEWLGDVPEHWDVKPIGRVCPFISYGFTNPMPGADEGPYMLTANDIGDGRILYDMARHTTQASFDNALTAKSRPVKGDVLVTKDGTLGRVAVSDGRLACINQSVALLRPSRDQVLPSFLGLALRAPLYQERMVTDAGGTAIKHIYITRLAKMRMAFPGIGEQRRVVRSVEATVSTLDRGVFRARREIDLVREYRARLIADVVTGKLDVREEAARLPDETDEPEPLEAIETEGEIEEAEADDGAEVAEEAYA